MSKIHASGWLVINADTGEPIDTDDFSGGGGSQNTVIPFSSSTTWAIPYSSTVPPIVSCVDSTGSVIHPTITYPAPNLILANFGSSTSGYAILS